MGETTDKIETYMGQQRKHLGSNLRELEDKVKSATDWQNHFRAHPFLALGVAVGGGALVASLVARSPKAEVANRVSSARRPSVHRDELRSHWNQIKSAGIAIAVQRVVGYVDDALPGFKEQLGKVGSR